MRAATTVAGRWRRRPPSGAAAALEARSFRQAMRGLGARDRRVIALLLQRLAEIEAVEGEAAAEVALEGVFFSLAQRPPLAG